jgi:hypothetical protein
MSKLVSLRLEDELAEWVDSYRVSRGWARAELIDAALRSYREETLTGVPDLPVVARPTPEPDEIERARQEHRAAIWARQQKLNEAKECASR